MNYRFWADQHIETEVVVGGEIIVEDCVGAKACPKCDRLMTKFQIGGRSGNKIELCTGCDEVWLDKGEWQLLKKLDLHNKLPKIFTDAWQRNIRVERQEKKLKARFQEKLGAEDFVKVDDFKQWLDQHPEKSEIKQYLITAVI